MRVHVYFNIYSLLNVYYIKYILYICFTELRIQMGLWNNSIIHSCFHNIYMKNMTFTYFSN